MFPHLTPEITIMNNGIKIIKTFCLALQSWKNWICLNLNSALSSTKAANRNSSWLLMGGAGRRLNSQSMHWTETESNKDLLCILKGSFHYFSSIFNLEFKRYQYRHSAPRSTLLRRMSRCQLSYLFVNTKQPRFLLEHPGLPKFHGQTAGGRGAWQDTVNSSTVSVLIQPSQHWVWLG